MPAKPLGLAVKAVLLDAAGRTLLVRRSASNRSFVGQWEWPGGKVDPGEDFAKAVERETLEETGLQVEVTGLAGATSFEMPRIRVILLCLECRRAGGALTLSHEHDDSAWVPFSDLPRWNLAESVRDFMLAYAAGRAGTRRGNP